MITAGLHIHQQFCAILPSIPTTRHAEKLGRTRSVHATTLPRRRPVLWAKMECIESPLFIRFGVWSPWEDSALLTRLLLLMLLICRTCCMTAFATACMEFGPPSPLLFLLSLSLSLSLSLQWCVVCYGYPELLMLKGRISRGMPRRVSIMPMSMKGSLFLSEGWYSESTLSAVKCILR